MLTTSLVWVAIDPLLTRRIPANHLSTPFKTMNATPPTAHGLYALAQSTSATASNCLRMAVFRASPNASLNTPFAMVLHARPRPGLSKSWSTDMVHSSVNHAIPDLCRKALAGGLPEYLEENHVRSRNFGEWGPNGMEVTDHLELVQAWTEVNGAPPCELDIIERPEEVFRGALKLANAEAHVHYTREGVCEWSRSSFPAVVLLTV